MKVILAINQSNMENFISQIEYLQIIDIVNTKKHLISSVMQHKPNLVIMSNTLNGNEDIKQIVHDLTLDEYCEMKIVFLYGEVDEEYEGFCQYLRIRGVENCYLGDIISSSNLDSIIYKEVYGYKGIRYNFQKSLLNIKFHNFIKYLINSDKIRKIKSKSQIENVTISIYSNNVTGKTHTAWNLATCFADSGYTTTLLSLDTGYSSNIYFGIDEVYHNVLNHVLDNGIYKDILNMCYKIGNLSIVTGELGSKKKITKDDFEKLVYHIRAKSNITIIDTASTYDDITYAAIKSSNIDLLVFDCDLMHFHSNKLLLEQIKEEFIDEKTIVIINNCDVGSSAYKYIFNELKKLNYNFKDIIPLSNCGMVSCELMHTGKVPYQIKNNQTSDYIRDMNKLLRILNLYK